MNKIKRKKEVITFFGEELALEGFDTWIIEPYGGPTTECDTCPVYTVANLTEYYWPALITGVQNYSTQDTLSYVGFDLGCTIALESLEMYESGKANAGYIFNSETGDYELDDLSADPIDTFVGLGCIGDIDQYLVIDIIGQTEQLLPPFFEYFNRSYEYIDFNSEHPKGANAFSEIAFNTRPLGTGVGSGIALFLSINFPKNRVGMSTGIYTDFYNWINNEEVSIGENVNFTNALIVQSNYTNGFFLLKTIADEIITTPDVHRDGSDEIVTPRNQKEICQNIDVTNNQYYVQLENIPHHDAFFSLDTERISFGLGLPSDHEVQDLVKQFLTNKQVENRTNYQIISTGDNCE